jgi:hypothetical protein
MAQEQTLLDTLKNYLDITWQDEHTDAKLSGILARAQTKICAYAGYDLEFTEGTDELQLLLDMCRYVYNNASEDFETNYLADLLMLRAKYKVIEHESETEDTGAGA